MANLKILVLPLFIFAHSVHGFGIALPFGNLNLALPGIPSFPAMPMPSMEDPMFNEDNGLFKDIGGMPEMPLFNADAKDVKTSKKTEHKDGYEITTVNKTGPGFYSSMSEIHNDGKKGKGEKFNIDSFTAGAGNVMGMLNPKAGFKKKCGRKCKPDEYCNPFFGQCRKQLPEGSTCMFKRQCEKSLQCVWGKCNVAQPGDAGTFCKKKSDCKNGCCVKQGDAFHAVCTPPLDEGAMCSGTVSNMFLSALISGQGEEKDQKCNPCKAGLKCANVGSGINTKRCVPESFVVQPQKESDSQTEEEKETPGAEEKEDDDETNEESESSDDDDNHENQEEIGEDDASGVNPATDPKKGKSSEAKLKGNKNKKVKKEKKNKKQKKKQSKND